MKLPTMEQYNEVLQHPHLSLTDAELRQGKIATTGLGLPRVHSGGFTLTYEVTSGSKKHAVRCFHKRSDSLERRYDAIIKRIRALRSPYFIDVDFQPQGVRVDGQSFPIVKMAWAKGETLGEFLQNHHRDKAALRQLMKSLRELSSYLETHGIAHGDIQSGNLMVADAGRLIQLIDYDGMYVDDLEDLGSAELGHRNFQHPERSGDTWNAQLDRFSFILLTTAIAALSGDPGLWNRYSDEDCVLFKANDIADPDQSKAFAELSRSPFSTDVMNFASVCRSSISMVPSLEDFLARQNIPQIRIPAGNLPTPRGYIPANPVLDATNYQACERHVGDRVELIGKILAVKVGSTKRGAPYVFVNFGHWRGKTVKLNIWSEGIAKLKKCPDESWVNKWVAVTGLMEPAYVNPNHGYSHLSINISQSNQICKISAKEANLRLFGSSSPPKKPASESKRPAGGLTGNQAILQNMKDVQARASLKDTTTTRPTHGAQQTPTTRPAPTHQPVSNQQVSSNSSADVRPCSRCGVKIRFPQPHIASIFRCPKCGEKDHVGPPARSPAPGPPACQTPISSTSQAPSPNQKGVIETIWGWFFD